MKFPRHPATEAPACPRSPSSVRGGVARKGPKARPQVQHRGTNDKRQNRPSTWAWQDGGGGVENQAGQKMLPPEVDRGPSAHRALSQPVTRPH